MKKYYKLGVKIEEKIKWLNLYDYKYNAFKAKSQLNKIGFKKYEIIIETKGQYMLYKKIDLPSDEPVQYVGVYVLKWGEEEQPTVGFVEVDEDE